MPTTFFPYTLTLQAPLLVSTLEGDPNSVRTAAYVPGSTLRGAVAAALGATDPDFHDLVLSGCVRYLHAYPEATGGTGRSLPIPLSWRIDKHGVGTHVADLAGLPPAAPWRDEEDDEEESEMLAEPQWAAPPARFVTASPTPREVHASLVMNFHNQRDREMGRPTLERGAIFTYEALEAGTRLAGVLAIDGDDSTATRRFEKLRGTIGTRVRLGRSRHSQYSGDAKLDSWGPQRDREIATQWYPLTDKLRAGDTFRILLTSDAIVRDSVTGQVDPAALSAIIDAAIATKGHGGGPSVSRIKVESCYTATTYVSGFNRKWRLALPQMPAVAAGTVVVLRALDTIPITDLRALEAAGLGERRSEGYGACLFLRVAPGTLTLHGVLPSEPTRIPSAAFPQALEKLQERLYEAARELAVERLAASLAAPGAVRGQLPSPALLGRLRVPLRAGESGLDTLRTWMGDTDQSATLRSEARGQIEKCKLDSVSLDRWIRGAIRDDLASLDALGARLFAEVPLAEWSFQSLSNEAERAKRRDLARASRRALVDTVLALLARRAKGGPDGL